MKTKRKCNLYNFIYKNEMEKYLIPKWKGILVLNFIVKTKKENGEIRKGNG